MKTQNKIKKAVGLTLGVLAALAFIVVLGTFQVPKSYAQTTNYVVSNNYSGPYYSVSNLVVIGSATILANDPVTDTAVNVTGTNAYLNGTNYSGGFIYPAGIHNSQYDAFGLIVTTTNASAKGTYTATVQGGCGGGDWTNICTITVPAIGLGTYSSALSVNVGALTQFRLSQITESGESNYTATVTFDTSSKPGI